MALLISSLSLLTAFSLDMVPWFVVFHEELNLYICMALPFRLPRFFFPQSPKRQVAASLAPFQLHHDPDLMLEFRVWSILLKDTQSHQMPTSRPPTWATPLTLRELVRSPNLPNICTTRCQPCTASTSSWYGSTSPLRCWRTISSPTVQLLNRSSLLHSVSSSTTASCSQPALKRSSTYTFIRHASSNSRWITRQKSDRFAKEAKVSNLKSRAAFKLLQINERYKIFKPGMTVVDLGFAPGSWSQVAIDLVRPGLGRVVGVDLIPVAPPKGVNGIQGDFLSHETQERVRELLRDENAGRVRQNPLLQDADVIQEEETSYIDRERAATAESDSEEKNSGESRLSAEAGSNDICVDVVLSDMSAPWEILTSSHLSGKNSLSNPYYRMMNTSGNKFKDHAGSMVCFLLHPLSPAIHGLLLHYLTIMCSRLTLKSTGSLPLRFVLRLRHSQGRRPFRLQILPRW